MKIINPATEDVLADVELADAAEVDRAVERARTAYPAWREVSPGDRARLLRRFADLVGEHGEELARLELANAGHTIGNARWEAGAVRDVLHFYAAAPERNHGKQIPVPGGVDITFQEPLGVVGVIVPWNFPMLIMSWGVAPALAAGNTVIVKPAEWTPLSALRLAELALAAGLPEGVLQVLPGAGEVAGARLVEHPDVAVIAFTGSRAVGLAINQRAAVPSPGQRHVKRVIAEMGGKNALVIDADADPDQAVPGAVLSAFGYAGQKCSAASRLIVVGPIYDQIVSRLVAATRELVVGHPRHPATQVGPVIDEDAHKRVHRYIEEAPQAGRVLVQLDHDDGVPEDGYFVGPTVVEVDDPDVPLAREEIFGPVLTVLRAGDLDEAIDLVNRTEYALTAGIYSRSPAAIGRAAAELRAGNVYINRHITGAVVGRQPFGGYGLSGVGSKAGGPDYLHQFLDPRVVTENTLRQGFAPDA
jgi:predicted delta-1-pyrroline-5-carboxylate dehydrogenase group 2